MPYFSMPINLFVSPQKVLLSSFYNIYIYIYYDCSSLQFSGVLRNIVGGTSLRFSKYKTYR